MKIMDTCSLIRLYKEIVFPEALHIWNKAGYQIVAPEAVFEELNRNTITISKVEEDRENSRLTNINIVSEEDRNKLMNRHPNLGKGEIDVILTGMKMRDENERYYCITDDRIAEKIARRYELNTADSRRLIGALYSRRYIAEIVFRDLELRMQRL